MYNVRICSIYFSQVSTYNSAAITKFGKLVYLTVSYRKGLFELVSLCVRRLYM